MQPLHRAEELVVGDRQRRHLRDEGADRLHDPLLHREDPLDVPVHDLGQGQQSQRLRGRRAVDHEQVGGPLVDVPFDVDEAEDLVQAGDDRQLLRLIVSTPAQFMSAMKYSWMSRQFVSRRSWASILLGPQVLGDARLEPISMSNESPSECAGSVLITTVRSPDRAARTAVAAATVVLPTPPFPVNSRTRIGTSLATSHAPPSGGSELSRARPVA